MSDEIWRCPDESMIRASEWVAGQERGEIEEFRQKTRAVFEWTDVEPLEQSALAAELATELQDRGLRPRFQYKTKSIAGIVGREELGAPHILWEFWLSDDGITSLAVSHGETLELGFETIFSAGDLMVASMGSPPIQRQENVEWLTFDSADPITGYELHRVRVRERVESGEIALSRAADEDRVAWWNHYADYLSTRQLADALGMAEFSFGEVSDSGRSSWLPMAAIALVLLLAIGIAVYFTADVTQAYWAWAATFWPIALIVVAPTAIVGYAVMLFQAHMNHLDHKYPDALDEHAGFWIKGRIRAEGLGETVTVGKAKEGFLSGLDAYMPLTNEIVLGHRTYEKQDPTFWAIAAHELGHAIDRHRRPAMVPLSLVSRIMQPRLLGWVTAGLLANTLFGWSAANDVMRWLLGAAMGFGAVVLIDEVAASWIGLRILGEDPRITKPMMVDLRRHLGLAFATYLSSFLGVAALFVAWDLIAGYIETHATFHPAEPLHPGRTALGNILSVLVLAGVIVVEQKRVRRLLGRAAPGRPAADPLTEFCAKCGQRFPSGTAQCPNDGTELLEVGPEEVEREFDGAKLAFGCLGILAGIAAAIGFVLEVWNQPLDGWYRAAVFAYAPLVTILFAPVTVPLGLALGIPKLVITRLGLLPKPPIEGRAARVRAATVDVADEIQVIDPRRGTPWYLDLASPGLFLHALPLVALWWASQL